jgi:hypothetical protein
MLERWAPSTHASLAKLAERVYGAPSGRTTAEWLLINKVISPVTFPTKFWLGHLLAKRVNGSNQVAAQQEGKD